MSASILTWFYLGREPTSLLGINISVWAFFSFSFERVWD